MSGMGQVRAVDTHGVLGRKVDAVRVVNDAVQDGVRDPAASEILVPVGHRYLRSDERGAGTLLAAPGRFMFYRAGRWMDNVQLPAATVIKQTLWGRAIVRLETVRRPRCISNL